MWNFSFQVVGWGVTTNGGIEDSKDASEYLMVAELPYISFSECVGKIQHITSDKFCGGAKTGNKVFRIEYQLEEKWTVIVAIVCYRCIGSARRQRRGFRLQIWKSLLSSWCSQYKRQVFGFFHQRIHKCCVLYILDTEICLTGIINVSIIWW